MDNRWITQNLDKLNLNSTGLNVVDYDYTRTIFVPYDILSKSNDSKINELLKDESIKTFISGGIPSVLILKSKRIYFLDKDF